MKEKNKSIIAILVISILIITVSMTYAFFQAQGGESVSRDVRIHTHTTDMLTFEIDDEIEFEVTQENFAEGAGSLEMGTDARAILNANSKTNLASDKYNMYLKINNNELGYSAANTNKVPEVIVTIQDSEGNYIVPAAEWCDVDENGFVYDCFETENICNAEKYEYGNTTCEEISKCKTVTYSVMENNTLVNKTVTGYDVTEKAGLIELLTDEEIEVLLADNGEKEEEWTVTVTFINHSFNQNDNTGKSFDAEVIMQKDYYAISSVADVCEDGDNFAKCLKKTFTRNGENGFYYHTDEMEVIDNPFRNIEFKLELELLDNLVDRFSGEEEDYNDYCIKTITENVLAIKSCALSDSTIEEMAEDFIYIDDPNDLPDAVDYIKEVYADIINPSENEYLSGIKYKTKMQEGAGDRSYRFAGYDDVMQLSKSVRSGNADIGEGFSSIIVIGTDGETGDTSLYINKLSAITENSEPLVKNYVCFGSSATTCPEANLYRILGVFGDNIKLVKATSWGNYAWDTNGGTSWETSSIYSLLNQTTAGGFLNTLSGYENKIADWDWVTNSIVRDNYYETFKNLYLNEIINPISSNSVNSKIGLMYINDYLYTIEPIFEFASDSYSAGLLWNHNSLPYMEDPLLNWYYPIDGENTFDWFADEAYNIWSMTTIEEYSTTKISTVDGSESRYYSLSPTSTTQKAIYPTFYLKSDVTYDSGTGTLENPYRIN